MSSKITRPRKKRLTPSKTRFTSERQQPLALKRNALQLLKPLSTLSSTFIPLEKLKVVFGEKDKVDSTFITRFIELNQSNMHFLDIRLEGVYESGRSGIRIHTGRYAGAIPVKSPKSSLYVVDMLVKGSYTSGLSDDDLYSILSETGCDVLAEFDDRLRLVGKSMRAPIYFECEEYLKVYEKVVSSQWNKFRSIVKVEHRPRGNTDWSRYARGVYDPRQALSFHNRINVLSPIHHELMQANYVLAIAMAKIERLPVGNAVRQRTADILGRLRNLPEAQPSEKAERLRLKATDTTDVKHLKEIGNRILTNSSQSFQAWRLDIAKIFEAYVQAALGKVDAGWQMRINPRYPINGHRLPWGLSYLEPDILLRKGEEEVIIDAKYKSHLLNTNSINSHHLKESFREDLHQVIAYSALSNQPSKRVMLFYPIVCHERGTASASGVERDSCKSTPTQYKLLSVISQTLISPYNGGKCEINLVGLPFIKGHLKEIGVELRSLLLDHNFESNHGLIHDDTR